MMLVIKDENIGEVHVVTTGSFLGLEAHTKKLVWNLELQLELVLASPLNNERPGVEPTPITMVNI